ncbi:MAG: type II toxin-antitoxin system VapC family toxin [Desulfobacteraceae bacterium]|nr:type II toxin-antitoxin system VapC family toxin [Desulfobacteraceae bacterium]
MVLVDTSVWVSHLREGNAQLADLLNKSEVLCHPFVVGELAGGNLKDRAVILSYLEFLPMGVLAQHEEVLSFIEDNRLMGKGLGYIDFHLLASAVLTDVPLWTLDKRLDRVAGSMHFQFRGAK